MAELKVRKDIDEQVVEVNTGDGWNKLAPSGARDMADSYEEMMDAGEIPEHSGTRRFIETLREYADDVEEI